MTKRFDLAATPTSGCWPRPRSPRRRRSDFGRLTWGLGQLKRDVVACRELLVDLGRTKRSIRKEVSAGPDHPWRDNSFPPRGFFEDIFREATESSYEDILTCVRSSPSTPSVCFSPGGVNVPSLPQHPVLSVAAQILSCIGIELDPEGVIDATLAFLAGRTSIGLAADVIKGHYLFRQSLIVSSEECLSALRVCLQSELFQSEL